MILIKNFQTVFFNQKVIYLLNKSIKEINRTTNAKNNKLINKNKK
jgi:hypothetical protein